MPSRVNSREKMVTVPDLNLKHLERLRGTDPLQGGGEVILGSDPWEVLWTGMPSELRNVVRDSGGPEKGHANRGLSNRQSQANQVTPNSNDSPDEDPGAA